MLELLYEDITKKIRGCIYNVHNEIGPGYDEEIYHRGLVLSFEKSRVPFSSKDRKTLMHRTKEIKTYELDLIVYDKVILELKCIQSDFLQANYIQIISQLKLWEKQLGLLVNFGLQSIKIKRLPFSEKETLIEENYEHIKTRFNPGDRECLGKFREAIFAVFNHHGLGYGESIYQQLIVAELKYRKIDYVVETQIKAEFQGEFLKNYILKLPVIESRIICCVTAIKDKIDSYDIARMRTYLKALNKNIGLIVNFGKKQLQIRGVHA